jgi:hypothetical protein
LQDKIVKLLSLASKNIYGVFTYAINFFIGLLTVNTYAPLTEGWWHVYARWIDQGRVPYKDFELLVTPGFPYITWFFTHLVGEEFLHLRIVGLVFQAGISLLLFLVLSKHVSKLTSAGLATLGTTLLYSGTASIPFDYNYFAVFFAILSIYFLQKDYEKRNSYLYLAGISVAAVFLIKQSTGLCLFFFITLIPFLDRSFLSIAKVRLWLKFFVGFLIPLTLVSIALMMRGAFTQMLEQVFVNSSGVKGGLVTVLTQWIDGIYEPFSFGYAIRGLLVFAILALVFIQIVKLKSVRFNFDRFGVVFTLVVGLVIAGETVRSRFSSSENIFRKFLEDVYAQASPYIFLEPLLLILFVLFWTLRKRKYEWLPILMLALAMTYSTGMSAGLTEYGIFMNILVVGAWLDQYLNSRFLSYLIVILSLIFSSSLVLKKYESPYSWWGYNLPSIYEATQLSKQGLTERLHFSPDEYNEFTDIQTRLRNLPCGGEIISYPHIPLFLLDQKALPGGQAAMYWYDFVSNKTLTKEANRFESAQIAAVVEKILPGVERSHEELFGTENGQVRTKLLGMLLNKTNDFEAIDYENLGIRALYCLK